MRVEKLLIAGALCSVTPYTGFAATANHEGRAGHASQKPDAALDAALAARTRTPGNIERDKYRHPRDTLSFLGIRPGITVGDICPGAGWYPYILVTYLAGSCTYYVAAPKGQYGESISPTLQAPLT